MRRILQLLIAFCNFYPVYGQTTFFQDDFEGPTVWFGFGSNTPNYWVQGSCTNNGGSKALYITSGGTTNDCTPTGTEHYGYSDNPSGSNTALAYFPIDASCFNTMTLHADVQIEGEFGLDYLELVYSTDMGGTWQVLGSSIVANASYTPLTQALPAVLDNTSFWVGFRFTYNDSNIGNKAPAIDNLSIEGTSTDVTPPTITCPGTQTVYSDEFCNYALADFTGLATASDNCGILNISQSPIVGTNFSSNTIITLTATDGSSNTSSCQFTLEVLDTVAPKPSCPSTDTIYADNTCSGAIIDYTTVVTVEEHCTAPNDLVFNQSPPPGTVISAPVNVFITVTDLSGNSKTCFTHIFIYDTINPVISCPATDTVATNNGCTYDAGNLGTVATVTDNCSTVFTINQSPAQGTNLPAGETDVTLQAIDAQGNSVSCQFTLVVVDQEAPQVLCPPVVTIPTGSNCMATLGDVTPNVSATDNCSPSNLLIFNQDLPITHTFSGTISVQVSATDTVGNSGSCLLQVQAIDTTAPAVSCLTDTLVSMSGSCDLTVPDLSGTHSAVDNCTPSNLLTVLQSPAAGTSVSTPVQIAISYQDTSGNIGVCYTQIIPDDSVVPTITCPGTQTYNNGTSCYYAIPDYTGLATANDNCSNYTLSQNPPIGTNLLSGNNQITLTVTDVAGNQASCTFTLHITETILPTIVCPGNVSTCNPMVSYTVSGSDNCGYIITQTDASGFSSGSVFPVGTTVQSYQITDSSGNISSCSFNVEVLEYPDTAKVIDSAIFLCNTYTTAIAAEPIQTGTGSWSVISGGGTIANANALNTTVSNLSDGMNKLVWTVQTSACGSTNDTLYITVNQPPTPAQVQDTTFVCANSGFLVQGNIPQTGTGTWSNNSGIVLNNIHAPIVTIVTATPGYHTLYWTINSPGCPSSVDSTVLFAPEIAHVNTPDTSLCTDALPLAISGNAVSNQQHSFWIITSGSATIANKYLSETQITAAAPGELTIIYQLTHPFCGNTQDTIHIQLNACNGNTFDIPTLFTPNADGKNDFFIIPNLSETYPDCQVTIINRWGSIIFESTGYQEPWDGRYKGESVPMGTYFYEIVSPSGSFEPIKGSISIIY